MSKSTNKRWSRQARKEVVLRMLAGEPLDELSRELEVESFRLEQWRDAAVEAMDIGLKGKGKDPGNRELEQARATIGRLTMELEVYQGKAKRRTL